MSYQWLNDRRAYKRKLKFKNVLRKEKAQNHPLESKTQSMHTKDPLDVMDPLTIQNLDPLTRMAVSETQGNGFTVNPSEGFLIYRSTKDTFEPWSVKKHAILTKFTTQEKLSLTTSVYGASGDGSASVAEVHGVSEKVLHRLEQLDSDTGSKQFFGGLSQEEYTAKINQLDQQLTDAWNADLRVNALKIAIQCCKLLGETSVVYFYPTKFVIITDILDKFGWMVYNRLKGKQNDTLSVEVAKETCKNWFFKVGSIRELLPRVVIELAILKSYSFISPNPDYGVILRRLLSSVWGIGDPVVSVYLRCYLCRVAMDLIPDHKELYMQCFQDLLLLHDQVLDNFRNSRQMSESKVSMESYVSVLLPGVEWILQCLVHRGEHLHYTLQLVSSLPPFWKSVLMSSVLSTFPPSFISEECISILDMTLTLESNLARILQNLGLCLVVTDSHQDHVKDIWNRVWPEIKKLQNREEYLAVAQIWVEFLVKHFGNETVNEFLEHILSRITFRDVEMYHGMFANIVEKLLIFSNDITSLLYMNKFLKLVTMLNPDVSKNVLSTFNSKNTQPVHDSLLVSTLMHLATTLHDSVDALTPVDEVKQIGNLICAFVLRVHYGRDFEKLLEFYDEARGAFTSIDFVAVQLIQCVCRLAMEVRALVDGHHTKRTKGFISACVAYAFITIPSLESIYSQLQLYLLASQVAYSNHCISQGDSCVKAAITMLNESRTEIDCSEPVLESYVSNLLSTLIAVPDNPKESMLYLLKGFVTIDWNGSQPLLAAQTLLGVYAQEKYPYHFVGVDANDSLYGGSAEFINEVNSMSSTLLNEILNKLKILGDSTQYKKQGKLGLDLFLELVNWGDVTRMENLAVNIFNLVKKNNDPKFLSKILHFLRGQATSRPELAALVSRISVE